MTEVPTCEDIVSMIDGQLKEAKGEIVRLEDARHALLGTKRRGRPPRATPETTKAPAGRS